LADSLESSKVCDPLAKKRTIKLGNKDKSALHITDGRMFKSWTGSSTFNCVFEVQAIHKDELAVVIQNLYLRKDPITGECIDYVQVRKFKLPFFLHYFTKLPFVYSLGKRTRLTRTSSAAK
jgi:hypothetical protein